MATARTTALAPASGGIGSGILWNAHRHKKAELLGLTIDNQSVANQTVSLYDGFVTIASRVGATGVVQAIEFLGVSNVISGLVRLQITVPTGETVKLGEEDCKGIEFIGRVNAMASTTTSDCVIIAQYQHK
ncbi:hypothetical protein LCGC14_0263240 [marine sediment metagenome]|uniref:Uncharacterized protein n=1 Tax=marine sediment metagenome TaxID=412755 RepID=A0A0F9U619_9ZZZZ